MPTPLTTLLALTLAAAPARAAGAPPEAVAAPAVSEPAPPVLDTSAAEPLGYLSDQRLQFLKPKQARLPQHPYASTDFTAYALEWGEARIGLGSVTVGLLPRVQVGTSPTLDALGVYNVNAKANLLRLGPVDLAVGGSHYTMPLQAFNGHWTAGTASLSVRVLKPWSVHVSGSYVDLAATGATTIGDLPDWLVTRATGDRLSQAPEAVQQRAQEEIDQSEAALDLSARAATLKVATDIRFNRRDSLILQGQAMLWGELKTDVNTDLPPILGLDEALDTANSSNTPIADTYVASAAWQMQWKHLELRVGAGVSSIPGAWLLQSTDVAWRFGGKTRNG